jgi:hypothetical protein
MFTRQAIIAICSILVSACNDRPDQMHETDEIIDNLLSAGFPVNDITVVRDVVYVGRDASVSLQASREMLQGASGDKEQYRTNNLVGQPVTKICVNGPAFTGAFGTALDLAIQNYDEQPLQFAMARTPSASCSVTISAVIQPGLVGGFAGFPSNGLPFGQINIGDGLAPFSLDTIESVITHELGHAIGLRHSDFFDRSISCGGAPSNEGDGGVGAILIPGTPATAMPLGSVMNSCFSGAESGEFTASDITALTTLYPPVVAPCPLVWECRQCRPFTTQNILVDSCTREIVRARPCGEECF